MPAFPLASAESPQKTPLYGRRKGAAVFINAKSVHLGGLAEAPGRMSPKPFASYYFVFDPLYDLGLHNPYIVGPLL